MLKKKTIYFPRGNVSSVTLGQIFQTVKAIKLKLHTLIEPIVEKCSTLKADLCHPHFVSNCTLTISF